jgi:hypothetical protein
LACVFRDEQEGISIAQHPLDELLVTRWALSLPEQVRQSTGVKRVPLSKEFAHASVINYTGPANGCFHSHC